MALSLPTLILVILTLLGLTIVTYMMSSRMRIYLELAIILSIGIIGSLLLGPTMQSTNFGSVLFLLIFSGLLLLVMYLRFNHHISGPYKDMFSNSRRVLDENDMTVKFEIRLGGGGDMNKLKMNQEKTIEKFSVILSNISSYQKNIAVLFENMGNQTLDLSNDTQDIKEDTSKLVTTSDKMNDQMNKIKDDIFILRDRLDSEFALLSEYSSASDRISDQTNLIAVNAAIEAAQTDSGESNFSKIAEGIQRLSSRSRDNSKKLHQTILSMKRNLSKIIKEISKELEDLELQLDNLSEISRKTRSVANNQSARVYDFEDVYNEGKELTQTIDQLISPYKFE